MILVLRVYLYWSVLWGFLATPWLGLASMLPVLLNAADALVMVGCLVATWQGSSRLEQPTDRRRLLWTATGTALMLAYGLVSTVAHQGEVGSAAKYLGAMLRAQLLLMALFVTVRQPHCPHPAALYRQLRQDLAVLAAVQISIGTLQLIAPDWGANFVGVVVEGQSAQAALEEGDISGTFANSIDLAYFLVAAYTALTLGSWRRGNPPSAWLTAVFGVYVQATGSLAAVLCFALYATFLHARTWASRTQRLAGCAAATMFAMAVAWQLDSIAGAVLDKVDNMMLSRLGLLFVSLPAIGESQPAHLLTGFGTDFEVILNVLRSLPEVPLVFTYEDSAVVINDVFWVALVLGLGAPLTALILVQQAKLFSTYLGASDRSASAQGLRNSLLVVILLAGMLNQILLVRPFTVGLLLGLAPLALSNALQSREASRRRPSGQPPRSAVAA